jgi:hypothetical protein
MSTNTEIIDEAVSYLAKHFGEILVTKGIDKNATAANLFESFSEYIKLNVTPQSLMFDDLMKRRKDPASAQELHDRKMADAARLVAQLAEREKDQLKKAETMIDIFKLSNELSVVEIAKSVTAGEMPGVSFADVLMGHARLSKRAGESDQKAFTRLYESNESFRKADKASVEAGWIEHSKVNTMSVEVVSTEVGSASVSDDSMKAVQQLKDLAAQQHKTFEQVMLDNPELTARTYTAAHRPTTSSPSYAEMQRRRFQIRDGVISPPYRKQRRQLRLMAAGASVGGTGFITPWARFRRYRFLIFAAMKWRRDSAEMSLSFPLFGTGRAVAAGLFFISFADLAARPRSIDWEQDSE